MYWLFHHKSSMCTQWNWTNSKCYVCMVFVSLQWRHNDHDNVANHQPHGCLLNHLFRRRSKKTSKLRVTGLCVGKSPGPVNSPHKGPVTRKMFPFDYVIMSTLAACWPLHHSHSPLRYCAGLFFRLWDWLTLRCLRPWINHFPLYRFWLTYCR